MPLDGIIMAVIVLAFLVILVIIALIGYFKNWRGVPEDEVVIPPAPPEIYD